MAHGLLSLQSTPPQTICKKNGGGEGDDNSKNVKGDGDLQKQDNEDSNNNSDDSDLPAQPVKADTSLPTSGNDDKCDMFGKMDKIQHEVEVMISQGKGEEFSAEKLKTLRTILQLLQGDKEKEKLEREEKIHKINEQKKQDELENKRKEEEACKKEQEDIEEENRKAQDDLLCIAEEEEKKLEEDRAVKDEKICKMKIQKEKDESYAKTEDVKAESNYVKDIIIKDNKDKVGVEENDETGDVNEQDGICKIVRMRRKWNKVMALMMLIKLQTKLIHWKNLKLALRLMVMMD